MPIVFEEISGEVLPERRPDEPRAGERPARGTTPSVDDRVRTLLARAQRRAERLSDR